MEQINSVVSGTSSVQNPGSLASSHALNPFAAPYNGHVLGPFPQKPFAFNPNAVPFIPKKEGPSNGHESTTQPLPDAKFFIVKAKSREHVENSIRNGRWRSYNESGRKHLAEAYAYKPDSKVFLIFSVKGSGRFCGVAEVSGPYDRNPVYFCNGEVWRGSFPVAWRTVKDVPNAKFSHLLLDDGQPVTRSRDIEEVSSSIGYEMLSLFGCFKEEESGFHPRDSEFPCLI